MPYEKETLSRVMNCSPCIHRGYRHDLVFSLAIDVSFFCSLAPRKSLPAFAGEVVYFGVSERFYSSSGVNADTPRQLMLCAKQEIRSDAVWERNHRKSVDLLPLHLSGIRTLHGYPIDTRFVAVLFFGTRKVFAGVPWGYFFCWVCQSVLLRQWVGYQKTKNKNRVWMHKTGNPIRCRILKLMGWWLTHASTVPSRVKSRKYAIEISQVGSHSWLFYAHIAMLVIRLVKRMKEFLFPHPRWHCFVKEKNALH